MNDDIEISIENNDIDIDTDNINNEIEINRDETVRVVTSNYEDLQNKPSINNVVLVGNKNSRDLGIPEFTYNSTTETLTITLNQGGT